MLLFVSSLSCLSRCVLQTLKHGSGSHEYTHLGDIAKIGFFWGGKQIQYSSLEQATNTR